MKRKKRIKKIIFGTGIVLLIAATGYNLHKEKKQPPKIEIDFDSSSINADKTIAKIDEIISYHYSSTLSSVVEETEEIIIEDNRKLVALTFDDGPSKYTEEIVNILNEYDVKSTFFVLGDNCERHLTMLTTIAESGHEIAIHGDTHTSFTKLTIDEVNQEISFTIDYIESLGIDASELVRPPYGNLNDELKENIEYPFIMWNIDTEDWKTRDKEQIKQQILDNIQEGAIILMHDSSTEKTHNAVVEALKELLPDLTKEYKFITISDLSESHNIKLENGKAYRKIKSEN